MSQAYKNDVNRLNNLLGDEQFTAAARVTPQINQRYAGSDSYATCTGSYTLNTADGSFSGHTRKPLRSWNTTKTVLTFSGSAQNCKLNVTYHTKNTACCRSNHAEHDRIQCRAKERAACRHKIVEWTQHDYSNN